MSKKIIAILFILVFFSGLAGGFFYEKFYPAKFSARQEKICWDQSKRRLEEFGLFPKPESLPEIKSVYGTVISVAENKITLKIKPLDILADPELDIRIIEINGATKIYRMEKTENADVSKDASSESAYQNKEIKMEDIKAGNLISALSDSNIREQKNIKAEIVTVITANQ